MTEVNIGSRILITEYGYYGSIGQPYVIYDIYPQDLLEARKPVIAKMVLDSIDHAFDCPLMTLSASEELEHLMVHLQNKFLKNKIRCLHRHILDGDIIRPSHMSSLIIPATNRVIISKLIDQVLDLINGRVDEILPDTLVTEIEARIPDGIIENLLIYLQDRDIPYYDVEGDSRLLALGEGSVSIIINKRTEKRCIKYLTYPFPVLDIDEIEKSVWKTIEIDHNESVANSAGLINLIIDKSSDFKQLMLQGTIPKFLITGTNGKTSTTRLIAHILRYTKKAKIGLTSTAGIFIDDMAPQLGDFTGPWSARNTLSFPIDIGVFEVARGGLIREGVIFKSVECAIFTNVAADHIGLRGINTIEEMLNLKSLIFRPATRSIIINADDDLLFDLIINLKSGSKLLKETVQIWGFSTIKERILKFNHGIFLDGSEIKLLRNDDKGENWTDIGTIDKLASTNFGLISFMNINSCLALTTAISYGIDPDQAYISLQDFMGAIENNPGRGNFFEKFDRWFMLDYGHNPHALREIKQTIKNIQERYNPNRIIFLALTAGDRREDDLLEYGKILSKFPIDEVILKDLWVDLRGREVGEVGKLIETILIENGFIGKIHQEPDPIKAISLALDLSRKRDLVYLCAEKANIMLDIIMKHNFNS